MEGTICEIVRKNGDHGIIVYRDLDTSCGQSGGMILLLEESSKICDMIDIQRDGVKAFPMATEVAAVPDARVAVDAMRRESQAQPAPRVTERAACYLGSWAGPFCPHRCPYSASGA